MIPSAIRFYERTGGPNPPPGGDTAEPEEAGAEAE